MKSLNQGKSYRILHELWGKAKSAKIKGFLRNPFFYFGAVSVFLLIILFSDCSQLARLSYLKNSDAVFFNSFFRENKAMADSGDLFISQTDAAKLETPDLKLAQDNSLYGVSTPTVLNTQTLADIFGSSTDKKEIIEYTVQPGDTPQSVADNFHISLNTLLWANDLNAKSSLKSGQSLVVLPVSGVAYVVKSGDTLQDISKTYKSSVDDIIVFNNLNNEQDIFIGDVLILPNGIISPKKASTISPNYNNQVPLASNYFIFPAEGTITQLLHFFNAVDLANKCGTPIYAAGKGVVQRAQYGWNFGGGNLVTILHANGTVTYYGHLEKILVHSGDTVDVGQQVGIMGETGIATGCHVHFEVIGAKNPLSRYLLGAVIKYK